METTKCFTLQNLGSSLHYFCFNYLKKSHSQKYVGKTFVLSKSFKNRKGLHTYIRTYMHTFAHMYTHTHTRHSMHARTYVRTCTNYCVLIFMNV